MMAFASAIVIRVIHLMTQVRASSSTVPLSLMTLGSTILIHRLESTYY